MKCSVWSSLAISVCSALVFASPAAAHVTVSPPFLAAGDTGTLSLTGPNERREPMSGFSVTVPDDFRLVGTESTGGWSAELRGATATWRGGSLEPEAEETFRVVVEAPTAPGAARFEAVQHYPSGEVVTWFVAMTVTPEAETRSQNLGWGLVTAVLGLAVITALALLLLRRTRSLQER